MEMEGLIAKNNLLLKLKHKKEDETFTFPNMKIFQACSKQSILSSNKNWLLL